MCCLFDLQNEQLLNEVCTPSDILMLKFHVLDIPLKS